MDLKVKVQKVIEELRPKLESLADGYVELVEVDEEKRQVKVRLVGGRLH